MKKASLIILAVAALAMTACETPFTLSGTINIPGGDGNAPIGTIGFSHTWPRNLTTPKITSVEIKGEPIVLPESDPLPMEPEPPLPQKNQTPIIPGK